MTCTKCEFGFLNLFQVDEDTINKFESIGDVDIILAWIKEHPKSDVQVCDCCGDGESWYGVPGEHYNNSDKPGRNGPYAGNGGLAHCN